MSGKFDVTVPYTWLSGTADFAGRPIERLVNGFSDTRIRLSVNFFGAPALPLRDFAEYRQNLIIGASFAVTVPTSQYDWSRAVNLGANRWSFRPELGIAKALGPVTLEYSLGTTFFTENSSFLGGRARSQEPIVSMQGHAIYGFRSGIWASAAVSYLTGGRTAIDGESGDDLQRNWRVGATLSVPLSRNFSARLFGSHGVSTRTGNNYDLIGFALQYRWGCGL